MAEMPIYLDTNATTPIDPRVADAMEPYLYKRFGNPSSAHAYGIEARQAVEKARRQVAGLLGCTPGEVVFTSGGTESNNMAIRGASEALKTRGDHIITSAVEHPAVLEPCRYLETQGFRITVLPVDGFGRVDPAEVAAALTEDTILVSIMHANNEVGTILPVEEIAKLTRERGILFHTDAAQSVGKIPVRVDDLGVDLLSLAGHKFYAPKGVGALYIRSGVEIDRLLHGASHERGRRAGTENVLEIVGLGEAAEIADADLNKYTAHMRDLRDRMWQGFEDGLGNLEAIRLNGDPDRRLPNTLSVSFRDVEANTLLTRISDRVAASAGAACHAEGVDVSSVLQAMGVPLDYAMGTIRFSAGKMSTAAEIDRAVQVVIEELGALGV